MLRLETRWALLGTGGGNEAATERRETGMAIGPDRTSQMLPEDAGLDL